MRVHACRAQQKLETAERRFHHLWQQRLRRQRLRAREEEQATLETVRTQPIFVYDNTARLAIHSSNRENISHRYRRQRQQQ